MALCVIVGEVVTRLAIATFTLAWTHSVERTAWQEEWRVERDRLVLTVARVEGSGAGMEPGADAVAEDGWWRWRPDRALPSLLLARSAAVSDWSLCIEGACLALAGPADAPGPVELRPCA
jgi:hypothetical protein